MSDFADFVGFCWILLHFVESCRIIGFFQLCWTLDLIVGEGGSVFIFLISMGSRHLITHPCAPLRMPEIYQSQNFPFRRDTDNRNNTLFC